MVESGKRSRNSRDGRNGRGGRDADGDGRSQKKRHHDSKSDSSSDGELVVYRILCPNGLIGSVIGKGGKVINSLRQETNAVIKVVDPFPGASDRVVTIYCYVKGKDAVDISSYDMTPVCTAQDALLRVHTAIVSVSNFGDSDKKNKVEAKMLVPASQAANIIGKVGSTIKKLRAETNANIKVNPKEPNDPTQSCAMSFDNFILINGDVAAVKRALFSISAIMYKFPAREQISLDTTVPELQGSIIIPSDVPIFPAGSFYHGAEAAVHASRSITSVVGATPHMADFPGYADPSAAWNPYAPALPGVSGYGSLPQSEELVVRVLCPSDKIGRVIGKGGSSIKNMRQATGARIDIDDRKSNTEECVITITSTESVSDIKSASIEAVLLLQEKINDEDDGKVNFRLLVPSKVIGCLIGKSGSIINEMRKATKAEIRISKGDKPKRAADSEELVEVFGEVPNLRDAILQIVIRLRDDALRERDGKDVGQNAPPSDHLYSSSLSMPSVFSSVPPVNSLGYDQRMESGSGLGMMTGGSAYGYNTIQNDDGGYGSLSSYSSKSYARIPPYEMAIPANAVGKVLGKGGSNLINIQKLSGATIEITDSKLSSSELVAQISGTMEQQHMAENMIQAFIMSN